MLLNIKNSISEIAKLCDPIRNFCTTEKLSADICHDILLVIDEIVTNIISYAFEDGNTHYIDIEITKKDNFVLINIKDDGVSFDPLKKTDPDLSVDIEQREIGGLGIFLVKQISKSIEYQRFKNLNILTINIDINNN